MELLKAWGSKFSLFFDKYSNCIFVITMLLFVVLTTLGICTHEPWSDEANAWLIAQDLNLFEILKYMKYEGHMFVWYLILMPFAKLHMQYPMPMLIANLVFMWGAIFILWKKTPIHSIWKILITFSAPICYQYAVIGRCYSVGIFLLFTLCALFKDKFKHPYLYSILIILCANTNSLCLFGATAFGVLFFFDYIKKYKDFFKRKEFYVIILIAVLGIFIIGYQLLGADNQAQLLNIRKPLLPPAKIFWYMLTSGFQGMFIAENTKILFGISYIILALATFIFERKSLFFFIFTFLGLCFIFLNFYNGYRWHHYFFYIYLIVSIWLFNLNIKEKKIYHNSIYIFFSIISIFMITSNILYYHFDIFNKFSYAKLASEKVLNNPEIKKGNVVICDLFPIATIPYFRNKKYKVYNCLNQKEASFFDYSSDNFKKHPTDFIIKENLVPDLFSKFENKPIYIIAQTSNPKAQFVSNYYKLELIDCTPFSLTDGKLCIIKLTPAYDREK